MALAAAKKSSAGASGAQAPMKAHKAMKAKRASKVARGRFAKVLVFRGKKEKTSGGLSKDKLTVNKRGRVVSKRASAHGKRSFRNIESWIEAVMEARQSFNAKGFVAINGKSLQGKALYSKAKALRAAKMAPADGASAELKRIFDGAM
eukprot:TRINITY_DN61509_c0_g1_i1.p1 TRINITY_DN61509_c0_g1~~TRINITY_DN61509_c0_g1_i1.p1  ORF type:complete len:148 (-),score=47.69 TRINITY_DN61509_c0_g1_i1:46-489(-)